MLRYRIKLEPDDNDTLLVTCPALPEVTTFGNDETEARRRAADAIEEALAGRIADGAAIPIASANSRGPVVSLPLMTSLKAMLYNALRETGTTRAELSRRLKWKSQVGRSPVPSRPCLTPRSDRGRTPRVGPFGRHFGWKGCVTQPLAASTRIRSNACCDTRGRSQPGVVMAVLVHGHLRLPSRAERRGWPEQVRPGPTK